MFGKHNRLRNIYEFFIPVSGSQFTGSQAVFNEVSGATATFGNYTGPAGSSANFASASIGRLVAGVQLVTGSIQASGSQAWISRRDLGTVSSALDVDFSRGNNVSAFVTPTTCSVSLNNLQTGSIGVIEIEYSGSEPPVLVWPSNVRTPNSATIAISSVAPVEGVDIFTVYRRGSLIYLNVYGQRFSRT